MWPGEVWTRLNECAGRSVPYLVVQPLLNIMSCAVSKTDLINLNEINLYIFAFLFPLSLQPHLSLLYLPERFMQIPVICI